MQLSLVLGSSGGPILQAYPSSGSRRKGGEQFGAVLGIVSYANHTALEKSGTACILFSAIHDWVNSIIDDEVSTHEQC